MLAANRPSIVKTALLAGVTGAILIDFYLWLTEVLIMHRATTLILFQWDASNLLGARAFQAGVGVALFGCLLHLVVSLIWGSIYTFAAIRIQPLARHPIPVGAAFGVIVKLIMAHVIVPLGHAHMPTGMPWPYVLNNYAAHVIFFGIPVAWVASRAWKAQPRV